ncbi:hypothetical protein BaRGS_00019094 [Batillaria attramentaria]|uniref:Uncharacterized protein n=1 Tax=Batillaria attramentaria TaxID=370345 RepID=A0ABD0KS21_9CAEN
MTAEEARLSINPKMFSQTIHHDIGYLGSPSMYVEMGVKLPKTPNPAPRPQYVEGKETNRVDQQHDGRYPTDGNGTTGCAGRSGVIPSIDRPDCSDNDRFRRFQSPPLFHAGCCPAWTISDYADFAGCRRR